MSRDYIYIDGKVIPNDGSWQSSHFVYQTMRSNGERVLNSGAHLDMLNEAATALFGNRAPLNAAELKQAVAKLVRQSGRQPNMPHIVEMRLYADGRFICHINETSLYKQFAVRALRPKGVAYASQNSLGTLCTSAFQAELDLMRHYLMQQASGSVVVAYGNDNTILHIDGGTPIMMKGFEITIGESPKSVIAQLAADAATKLNDYKVSVRNFTLDEALEAQELLYIDHRGITPLAEIEGHRLAPITAYSIAEHIDCKME